MPSVAPNDSRKPGSNTAMGDSDRPRIAATPRRLIDGPRSSSRRPARNRTAAAIARSTDGARPVTRPYASSTTIATAAPNLGGTPSQRPSAEHEQGQNRNVPTGDGDDVIRPRGLQAFLVVFCEARAIADRNRGGNAGRSIAPRRNRRRENRSNPGPERRRPFGGR